MELELQGPSFCVTDGEIPLLSINCMDQKQQDISESKNELFLEKTYFFLDCSVFLCSICLVYAFNLKV